MNTASATDRDLDGDFVERLRIHLRHSTTDLADGVRVIEGESFTDPERARREREDLFGRVPFIVAHSSELPKAHDFVTVALPRNRALVIRQENGAVRAFLNVCRHRGAQLKDEAAGSCRVVSCRYHGWSYNPDGCLRSISDRRVFGDVDTADLGLVELPAEERHGFVWLIDRPGVPIDVASWLGGTMDALLAQYPLAEFVCYRFGAFDELVNWKVMQDAFLDGYHIKYAHAKSAGGYIHTNLNVYEDHGAHALIGSARTSLDRWVDTDPDDGTSLRDHVAIAHFLFPNCTLLRLHDHFQVLTFIPHPTDPGASRLEMRVVVPKRATTGLTDDTWSAMWDKNWNILLAVLRNEDFPILRAQQAAMASADAGPLIFGRNEIANQHFHRELERHLERDDV